MGTRTAADSAALRQLADPEFFTYWAALRTRLALTPIGSAGHSQIKNLYNAAAAEYQRRMDGALTSAS